MSSWLGARFASARAERRGTDPLALPAPLRRAGAKARVQPAQRMRSAFVITEAELRLIASAAIIGESSQPVSG